MDTTRRNFIKKSTAALGVVTLPGVITAQPGDTKQKIICVGAHPDDPESGCGGTLAKYTNAGHDVTIIYLTSGEAGIENKSHTEAATIRTKEAEAACKILNAKSIFIGQTDGDTVFNNDWLKKVQSIIEAEKPEIVFTHWPMDAHKDHQVASLLTMQVWMRSKNRFDLYFYEVCSGEQTMLFHPTDYVDISETQEQKRKAVYCHASQDPAAIYACGHEIAEKFRGAEIGVKAAEGFIKMTARNSKTLF
jgi:LmbE family N-acetylglucosaminyl deacetylase